MHSGVVMHMRTVPEKGDGWRALDKPIPCRMFNGTIGAIPKDFHWDGNSSGLLAPLFPQWNHPRASATHDYLCSLAKNPEERLFADREFRRLVGTTSWPVTAWLGYAGVRVGAMLGIGVRY